MLGVFDRPIVEPLLHVDAGHPAILVTILVTLTGVVELISPVMQDGVDRLLYYACMAAGMPGHFFSCAWCTEVWEMGFFSKVNCGCSSLQEMPSISMVDRMLLVSAEIQQNSIVFNFIYYRVHLVCAVPCPDVVVRNAEVEGARGGGHSHY